MSAYAGVFTRRRAGDATFDQHCQALELALKAAAAHVHFEEVAQENCKLWKFDAGAFGEPAVLCDPGSVVSTLAGHPFVENVLQKTRHEHLVFLTAAAREGRFSDYARARGSYSLVCADQSTGRLSLATDALGVRPVYFIDDGLHVIFSSTLAVLQELGRSVTGARDERAAVEIAVFGFALGNRSGLANVQCLGAGSVAQFDADGVRFLEYWSMSKLSFVSDASLDDSLSAVSDAFESAIRIRRAKDSVVMATLSGGMDSRAVVAALCSQGVGVNSLNFAPPNSQDLLFGNRIAAALGCNHTEIAIQSGSVLERMCFAFEQWQRTENVMKRPANRSRLIWSGDGGSVTLGHVYLTPEMVDAAESGNSDRAIDSLLWEQRWIVPRGVLRAKHAARASNYPPDGLRNVLREQSCPDPGRRLHMMLMATDQRRHMHPYYEAIFQHRSDMLLPFFDRKFVEAVVARPVRPFLNHSFYNKWFRRFSDVVFAVPWQAYPGHEPCPVPSDSKLAYQWSGSFDTTGPKLERARYLAIVRACLFQNAFVDTVVSPIRVSAAWASTALRIRDLTYALRFAVNVSK